MSREDSLEVPENGLHLLTGPNGSGKSTLARALAARTPGAQLLSAESQQAFYEAQLESDESNFAQGVDTSTTVGELLGEAARTHPLLAAFRLEGLWERGYRLLSTGEGRKLLLLRALLDAPSLLVLDDPFDGLDVAARAELGHAIAHVAEGHPVLLVGTWDAAQLPFASEAVRDVRELERGQLVFRGSLADYRARATKHARAQPAPPIDVGSFFAARDPAQPLVVLKQGRVRYGEHVIFDQLDFTVMPGQHTLIEGPNGSGKSSLLELITGDHPQAYSNDLSLFGRRRGTGETVWDIKQNVGLVSAKLHRDYRVGGSVEDVLISGLFDSIGVYREREPSHRERARRWLDWLALAITPDHPFRALSFGEQRLVLIARAAIKVPPLVVLDEPTNGLDPDNQTRVLALLESLCTQHRSTVLFVTHRQDERDFWHRRVAGACLTLRGKS